ncbi:hypothetical protein COV17_02875 [Candidatus Woesearchaeota archaeon CG10_big_fil_rev_8_21_14_0_10_36_11]|nr:MAG: hypothetical protein COV17_02875 [Candidatus Woesearchaeota archaeon CG10_big_fil_rev_8_21_14_0_10_36_11]
MKQRNINKEAWRYLDNHITIKKNLADGLINVRALAKKIIPEIHLDCSLNAIISAIRRYNSDLKEKEHLPQIYALLKKAKLLLRTRLASLLLKKNEKVRSKLANLYRIIDFEGGDTLRIFEVNKYIKIIVDEKTLPEIMSMFNKNEIVDIEENLGELTIIYNVKLTKTPGVFALLSNELAANNISIIDSTICHSEHLIIVKENDLQKGFSVVSTLTTRPNN